jgi:hypothetical protein
VGRVLFAHTRSEDLSKPWPCWREENRPGQTGTIVSIRSKDLVHKLCFWMFPFVANPTTIRCMNQPNAQILFALPSGEETMEWWLFIWSIWHIVQVPAYQFKA